MERMGERDAMDIILYYGREGLLHHMHDTAQHQLETVGEHAVFRFWKAVSLAMQGGYTEAMREYTACAGKREVAMAVLGGQIHALRNQRQIDQDAIDELEAKMMMEEKGATPGSWLHLGAFHWLIGDHIKARDFVQKVPSGVSDPYLNALSLMGWINLTSMRSAFVEKSIANFDKAVDPQQGGIPNHIDALLGKVAYLDLKKNYSAAVHQLNSIVALSTLSADLAVPVNVEKAKILIKKGQWELAAEVAQKILKRDSNNAQALMILTLYLMAEDSKHSLTVSNLKELTRALEATEPKTHQLFATVGRTLSRLALTPGMLGHTMALISRACELQPKNAEYISEKAYQLTLAGDWTAALDTYKQALQVDDGNLGALHGIIKTQLMLGKLDDAEQQLEFLNQMQISERPAELCYLVAVMQWKKHRDQEASIKALDEAVSIHTKTCQGQVPSYSFYEMFNPQLLLSIIREYLQHCPTEPVSATDPPSTVASKARKPLELLLKHVKGCLEAQLMLARTDFIQNDLEKAQHTINSCIRADPSFAEAHLLAAQIAFYQENFQQTQQALRQATTEFDVRNWPQYKLLQGKVASAIGKYDDALTELDAAKRLTQATTEGKSYRPLNVLDHVAIYIELAQVHVRLRDQAAAEQTIADAHALFRNTREEGRIVIAQAMIICKKDIDRGLSMLRSVPQASPYFLKAKAQMANIYLNVRNNKRAFAKCYEELVEAFPTAASYLFLGEAYMSIQEPEKAIEVFEKARSLDPNDAEMASKIGMAFITTHDYAKAIQYYNNAVKAEPSKLQLRHDLASLYWKLGNYEEAEKELKASLQKKEKTKSSEELRSIMDDVKTTLLLAKVYKGAGDHKRMCDALIQSRVYQSTVLSRLSGESPDFLQQQRTICANICVELGEYYRRQKVVDKAVTFHNEALRHDETHTKSMLALAKLYRDKGDLDGCEHQANALLRVDPSNEEASMMVADILFRKSKFDDATYHFQQLLEKKPGNYEALVLFVQLLRRAGRLAEAPRFFTAAEAQSRRQDPGLHYAKGLYHRHTNNPRDALNEFNKGRFPRDGNRWSEPCTCNMIEVYLNPDQDPRQWDDVEGSEERPDVAENVGWAQKLLKDVRDQEKKRILEAYVKIARRKKEELEGALVLFHEIMTGSQEMGADGVCVEGGTGLACGRSSRH